METFDSIDEMFRHYVPVYKSKSYRHLVASFIWDRSVADFMETVSAKRCANRRANYLIPGELERSRGAIRFGLKKEGHGYHGPRGDFCLVGGTHDGRDLTLFYRSVELIGGLHYDLALMAAVENVMGPIRRVNIMTPRANSFCLVGNSNEKLYQKLTKFYAGRA